jgi:PAS domain S-box-containing protein
MTFVNPAACTVLGYGSPEDLIGSSAHETIHYKRPNGSGFPRDECPLVSVFQSGEMLSGEEWFVRQDGSMVPVSYTCSPLPLAEGRGTVVAFRDQSERKAAKEKLQRDLDALSWIGRVRDALDEGRMVLHAQPIVELSTREVTQHELLLRMVDRDNGLVLPGRFLPIAERYGLAPEVDRWVIRRALTVPKEIGTVEINLSAASFGDLDLLGAIERGLTDTDVDPACVVFEITETALMEQIETGQRFARRLEELGCRLTLDDFGTGYGSFTYLKELPISFLKIDMQFIRGICRDVGNQRVVRRSSACQRRSASRRSPRALRMRRRPCCFTGWASTLAKAMRSAWRSPSKREQASRGKSSWRAGTGERRDDGAYVRVLRRVAVRSPR